MIAKKWVLVLMNLLGGTAVLGSYAYGILTNPGAVDALWGGVPASARPFYTIGMFLAATGYFAFTYFILFRLDPGEARFFRRFSFGYINLVYATILLPSALWMPLTILAVEQPGLASLWAVRLTLAIVALASLVLLFAILNVKPRYPVWAHRMAIAGILAFCLQTVLLDAIIWGTLFRI